MSSPPLDPAAPARAAIGPGSRATAPQPLLRRHPAPQRRRKGPVRFVAGHVRAAVARSLSLARSAIRAQGWFVVALLVADLAMIAGFVAFAYAEHYGLRHSPFYGNVKLSFIDGGYPEIYGYGKEVLIAALLLATHAATRQAVYRALGFLFIVVTLDDALALHEALGSLLAAATGVSVNFGELVSWAVLGLVPMLVVAAGYRHGDPRSRADAAAVMVGFAVLLFFAVGMDVVHGIVHRYVTGFQTVFTLAEDGGELLAQTLLCTLALGIFRNRHHAALPH